MSIIIVFVLSVFYFNMSCSTMQDWPNDVPCNLINNYINGKPHSNAKDLKNEYLYVLQFIEDTVNATKENLYKFETGNNFIIKYPVLVNKELIICEEESIRLMWDQNICEYRKEIGVDLITENIQLSRSVNSYNILIDYWHKKTGEILRNKYDIYNIYKELEPVMIKISKENYKITWK